MSLLLLLFLFPFIASVIAFVLPVGRQSRSIFLAISFIPLLILIFGHANWIGSNIQYPWIPSLSVQFHLAVDSLSLVFLYLTAVIIPISIYVFDAEEASYPNVYFGLVFLLEGLLIGFFTARDLVLFTIFWEAMLLPLYFIISSWGGINRQKAALKFLIYMIAGSSLMIAAVLGLYLSSATEQTSGSFDFSTLSNSAESSPYAFWILAVFLLAFLIKTPLFPFHAWLPDAYYEAPTGGTILLSAILSKAGIYGIVRIGLELFPESIKAWSPLVLGLAIIGVFYGGLAAWMQKDFKRLIAYSSFSHVNFILVGLFVFNPVAQEGAVLQAINHGITIAALFLAAGWLAVRLGSTEISKAGGLAKTMPLLCWFTLVFVLSSVALPGTNSFVGEIMILFGLFSDIPWLSVLLASSVILSAIYMLRWMQRVYFQTPIPWSSSLVDINRGEIVAAISLTAIIFWIGIYPSPILKEIEPIGEHTVSKKAVEKQT